MLAHQRVVDGATECCPHHPAEAGQSLQGRHHYRRQRKDRGQRKGHHGAQVPAVGVGVGVAFTGREQRLDVESAALDQVEVDHDDAVERSDDGTHGVDEAGHADLADHRDPQRADEERHAGGDQAADLEADRPGKEVGQVVGRGNEVGHQVDADGGGEEGDRRQQRQRQGVDPFDDIGGVGQGLAEQYQGTGGDDQRDKGEEGDVEGKPQQVAELHLTFGSDEAGEVAEVDHHGGEVGHHGTDHGSEGADATTAFPAGREDGAHRRQQLAAGLPPDHHHQRYHDHVDQRPRPVEEVLDTLDPRPEDRDLKQPHQHEGQPGDR